MERVVRVMVDGVQDPDRWIRLERKSDGDWILDFYDLGLPRAKSLILRTTITGWGMDRVIYGEQVRERGVTFCTESKSRNMVHITYRLKDWPFDSEWVLPRSDLLAAVVAG
jgi:hypothetical protein